MRAVLLAFIGGSLCACGSEKLRVVRPMEYAGMCDASCAVSLSSNIFAVANDEDNVLRLYRADKPGGAVKQLDLNAFLQVNGHSLEADLEGAARIGDRAFWIGSHGRNKDGKDRANRSRFFATDIKFAGGEPTLVPVGKPCNRLLEDLLADARFNQFEFAQAMRRSPKQAGAINIEGLAATPEGHLLIGFRNPIPEKKALIIPMLNPNEVIQGKPVHFGPALQLDLGGLGIRDFACHNGTFVIIAGPYDGKGKSHFYTWGGPGAKPEPMAVRKLGKFNPEAIVIYPEMGLQEFQVLSDDGNRMIDDCPCKLLKDPHLQTFRSVWLAQ
jgi:hypothetical protein